MTIPNFVYAALHYVRNQGVVNMAMNRFGVLRFVRRHNMKAYEWLNANPEAFAEALTTMMDWMPPADQRSTKERVTAAFKALRIHKMITRQNFMCCGGCASYALAEQAKAAIEKGKSPIGAVYYNRQNAQHFEDSGILYLSYGAVDVPGQTNEEEAVANTKIGNLVADAMRAEGLAVEWDGDPVKCIIVSEA